MPSLTSAVAAGRPTASNPSAAAPQPGFPGYPLLDALRDRRSRRFGLGMTMPAGPLRFASRHSPVPLSEDAEAALAWAACGISGPALADLSYAPGQGGNIMAGLVGRTVASGDCQPRGGQPLI